MPLHALVNEENIQISDVTLEEAKRLQERIRCEKLSVKMPCCSYKGHLKFSSRNNPFFCHNRDANCNWAPETEEHRRIKDLIYRACIAAGFETKTEYTENGKWKADVFAKHGNIKIAFEVQLTNQNYDQTLIRHLKYVEDGVICIWLFKQIPKVKECLFSNEPNIEKNMYELMFQNDNFIVKCGSHKPNISTFITSYLNALYRDTIAEPYSDIKIEEIPEWLKWVGIIFLVFLGWAFYKAMKGRRR